MGAIEDSYKVGHKEPSARARSHSKRTRGNNLPSMYLSGWSVPK